MNIQRGFLRIFIVSAVLSFGYGSYFTFSPNTWLYEKINYEELLQKIENELHREECSNGELGYFSPVEKPEEITYVVCGKQKVGEIGFCPILKDCEGLSKYAEILGQKKIQRGIKVNELSIEVIRSDVFSSKNQRRYESFLERIHNGFDSLIDFIIFAFILYSIFIITRWIAKGFKNT